MRAKGSQFERDVVAVLRECGYPWAERAYGAGRPDDRGDITGVPGFAIEAKACQRIELAQWMAEAQREAANVGPHVLPVVVAKRRMHSARDAYVIMTLADWAKATSGEG